MRTHTYILRRLSALLMVVMLGIASAFALPFDKYTISRDELPEEAQAMLNEYFPKAKIGMIKVDRHLLKKTDYDVRLTNGTTIEFSNKGKWTSINCKNREVPEALVPKAAQRYVKKNFPDLKVTSVKKKNGGSEVGLSDGVILRFDLLGTFKGVKIEEEDD